MAELNAKPFSAESGFLSRIFKGAPAYYAKPDLQQYFDSLEYNLDKHNKLVLGDAIGSIVLLPDSAWNIDKTLYNLHLGVTDPFVLEVGKHKVTLSPTSLDYVDSLGFSGSTRIQASEPLNPPSILESKITNVLLLAKKRTVTFTDDPVKGGIIGPNISSPLESSDVVEYYDFTLGVVKGTTVPDVVGERQVVCVVAQFTFYFDGYWKPLLINNFRSNQTNMDISGNKKYPLLNKVLSPFGQFDWLNKVMDSLNSLALRIDGSNDAITDLYVNKGANGRFKIITTQDYASITRAGIIRIATEVEVFDPTNNSAALTPYGMYKALGSTRKIYEIGIWDMQAVDLVAFPHNLGADWVKAVPSACSIKNDAGTTIYTFLDDNLGQFFIDATYITLHRLGSIFNSTDFSDEAVLNRGYVILDLVGVAQVNPLVPPDVDAGADLNLELSNLTYGTPILRSCRKTSGAYPAELGAISVAIELGANTANNNVTVEYRKFGGANWISSATAGGALGTSITMNANISDSPEPPFGIYHIRVRVTVNGVDYYSNIISVDFTKAEDTIWNDTVTAEIDFGTADAVAVDDYLGFQINAIAGGLRGLTFSGSLTSVGECAISTNKTTLASNFASAMNAAYTPELTAVAMGTKVFVTVNAGSQDNIAEIFIFKNVIPFSPIPTVGTYATGRLTPQSQLVSAGASNFVETTLTGIINSFIGTITNRGWSIVSGPLGSVQQTPLLTDQARFRFLAAGTWVLKFSVTTSDGSVTMEGSDLKTVIVTSGVVASPVLTLKHSDNTSGAKVYTIVDNAHILVIGAVTNLLSAEIASWEFSFRSTIDASGATVVGYTNWDTSGFTISGSQANFYVNRPLGQIQFRTRILKTDGSYTAYSNTLEGTINFSLQQAVFLGYNTPYLPDTGALGSVINGNYSVPALLQFKVKGLVTTPAFQTNWLSETYYVEYDPTNVQALPSTQNNYNYGFNITVEGSFDCNTSIGRSALKTALINALVSYAILPTSSAITSWYSGLGTWYEDDPNSSGEYGEVTYWTNAAQTTQTTKVFPPTRVHFGTTTPAPCMSFVHYGIISIFNAAPCNGSAEDFSFFTDLTPVISDISLPNGEFVIGINCKVYRGTAIANETLLTNNPPRLAKRVRVTGTVSNEVMG